VDTLHAITFIGIFAILLVSAFALKQYDAGRNERAEFINKRGATLVVTSYIIANIVFITLALV
jgi:hypothetical protein